MRSRNVKKSIAIAVSVILVLLAVSFLAPGTLSWLLSYPFVTLGLIILVIAALLSMFVTDGGTDHGLGRMLGDPLPSPAATPTAQSPVQQPSPQVGDSVAQTQQAAQTGQEQERALSNTDTLIQNLGASQSNDVALVNSKLSALFTAVNQMIAANTAGNVAERDSWLQKVRELSTNIIGEVRAERDVFEHERQVINSHKGIANLLNADENTFVERLGRLLDAAGIRRQDAQGYLGTAQQMLQTPPHPQTGENLAIMGLKELKQRYEVSLQASRKAEQDFEQINDEYLGLVPRLISAQEALIADLSQLQFAQVAAHRQTYVTLMQAFAELKARKEELTKRVIIITSQHTAMLGEFMGMLDGFKAAMAARR
jgi:hypothetical protein